MNLVLDADTIRFSSNFTVSPEWLLHVNNSLGVTATDNGVLSSSSVPLPVSSGNVTTGPSSSSTIFSNDERILQSTSIAWMPMLL